MLDYIASDPLRLFPVSSFVPKPIKNALIEKSNRKWEQYGQAELDIEINLLAHIAVRRKHIFHFIYGENTFCYSASHNRRGKAFIASYHQPVSWFSKLGRRSSPFMEKMKHLDAIIAMSNDQAEFLRKYNDNVFFVPHGIDVEFFTPDPKTRRDPKLCLFVGNWLRDFQTLKDVDRILRARDASIRVEAVTPEKNREQLKDSGIVVLSGISDLELRQKYREASVVIQPLIDCTANNAVLESMACGVPIAVSDVGGIRDYINEEYAIFCKQGNPDEMADAVIKLLGDPASSSRMGKAARAAAEKRFAWPVVARQMKDIYAKISF